ncbi:hypothetical protein V8F06_001471 [Rhypophila decipiens]
MDVDQGIHHGHGERDELSQPPPLPLAGQTDPFLDHLPEHSQQHSRPLHHSYNFQQHNLNNHIQNYRQESDLAPDRDQRQPEPQTHRSPADKPFSPAPPSNARPSQIPLPVLQTSFGAANANAAVLSPGSSAKANLHGHAYSNSNSSSNILSSPVEPDDFYRSYRGVQTARNASLSPSPVSDPMASAIPSNRQPPSNRPNGTAATTSRIPSPPTASRNALRPSYRAASNPLDDRSGNATGPRPSPATGYAAGPAAYPPSVKDLKKRFDSTSSGSPASGVRKTSTGTPRPARDTGSAATNGRSQTSGGGATSYSSLRASATRDTAHETGKASGSRATQRPKFVPEDQLSANSQSFASRISRPRNAATSPNRQASKSMTRVPSHNSPSLATSPPPLPRTGGLLFGEILPEDSDAATAGYGIEPPRPRRTSEPDALDGDRPRLRSFSDPDVDVEPSSPTDWYRAAAAPSQQTPNSNIPRTAASHTRAQSDVAGTKPLKLHIGRQLNDRASPASPISPTSPTSRLPIYMKRMSSSSNPSNESTRPNSPAAAKYGPASGRNSRQHGTLTNRAKTPTARSNTPSNLSKTQSSTTPGRKPPPANIATPSNSSGRLNAYVSPVPPPKLSPSLRSSRPRQSVATATTTASRMRTTEGQSSSRSQKPSQRKDAKTDEGSTSSGRRRKVSVGPIDFAQRRETIKLAYSKSIRESQAREARQAAAERRKKELEVVARIKAEAEASVEAAVASAASSQVGESPVLRERPSQIFKKVAFEKDAAIEKPAPVPEEPLKITTNLSLLQPNAAPAPNNVDSPTLGIPGSFPDIGSPPLDRDDIPVPHSAVSTATFTTEFDPDEQTEPARRESVTDSLVAIDNDLGIIGLAQNRHVPEPQVQVSSPSPTLQRQSSYHSPFDEDDAEDGDVPIKFSLDELAQHSPQLTPTRTEFQPFQETILLAPPTDEEYEPQPYTYTAPVYQTTVTILGPESEFRPVHRDQTTDMTSPSLSQQDIAPTLVTQTPVLEQSASSSGLLFEEPEQEIEGLQRLEDFYVGPHLRDNIASLRDSISSEPDGLYDEQPSTSEFQKTPDTSNSLSVPNYLTPGNRLSNTSAWTDFSFGSDDRNAGPASSTTHSHDLNRSEEKLVSRQSSEIGGLGIRRSGSLELSESQEGLASGVNSTTDVSMVADSVMGKDAGGFAKAVNTFLRPSASAASSKASLHQVYDHSDGRDRYSADIQRDDYDLDDGSYVGVTRPSSYLHEQEDEDTVDLTLAISATDSMNATSPQSLQPASTNQSLEQPLSAEARDSIDKEQKRLRQRQLVIRELIDTEDSFVRDMSVVEEIYKGTAEACPNLDSKTIKLVFRNTDEIIAFHQAFLAQLKDGAASVYTPKGRRSPQPGQEPKDSDAATMNSGYSGGSLNKHEMDDERDRQTSLGPLFVRNIDQLKRAHESYLRTSDASTKRLLQIQEDATVKVWLTECNEVAKELTSAWNLDSLLIKPMQRITKYPDIITHLLKYTPEDHPDHKALLAARSTVINTIDEINKSKKNFELVGQIVGSRKRKESDVRAGIARAFGKRVDKLQSANIKLADDDEFQKLHKNCHEEFLQLQFVLRDIEFYTRAVTVYVSDFLKYLSAMELVMRLQPSREYAHLESKWVQFNVSMRDVENIALERHLSDVRKHVIEPFEQVIKCYNNPLLAIKKRSKRRLDYDKYLQLKNNGKKVDKQLSELAEQYEALNDTLKKELPKLSELTAKVGNICLGKFVSIQTSWYGMWKEKVKGPLQDLGGHVPEPPEIVTAFQREFMLQEERALAIGIVNPTLKSRSSQSTTDDAASTFSRTRSRPNDLVNPRGRGLSINSEHNIPSLPTPDFGQRNSGQFSLSPSLPSPGHYYRDSYAGINGHARGSSNSPVTTDATLSASTARSTATLSARPNTGRSYESISLPRQSSDSAAMAYQHTHAQSRRDSNSTFNSLQPGHERRLSGLFHSALPLPDGPEDNNGPSRGSSPARGGPTYKVLWLAASLFEFNIETTKSEAGYPYLTYQAGEIFDVMAEKGELWLAKNQDDPNNGVGWIWSKHFAKLADA